MDGTPLKEGRFMEINVIIGLFLGIGGILVGNFIEGGHVSTLAQGTAALIVFGGTFGSTLIANRREDIKLALKFITRVFSSGEIAERTRVANEIVATAQLARKESILALEKRIANFSDEFMRSVYRFVVDGVDPEIIRKVFEEEIDLNERRKMAAAKVWSDAGGYAPTIGIIGAVLGLIHVMANITDTSALGKGIAVAFVATIYGVGSANLIFLPLANRLKSGIRYRSETEKMILEGGLAVIGGLNPYIIEQKVEAFTA
jgi:chemotaxis protein MotA